MKKFWFYLKNSCFFLRKWIKDNLLNIFIVIGITIVILLIIHMSIKNSSNNMSDVTQMICALLTAFVTIAGVKLTIYDNQRNNKENRRLEIKPFIAFENEASDKTIEKEITIGTIYYENDQFFENEIQLGFNKNEYACQFNPFGIYIADYANSVLYAIIVIRHGSTPQYIPIDQPILLKKDASYMIDISNYYFRQKERNKLISLQLCISDLNENYYYYDIETDEGMINEENGIKKIIYTVQTITERPYSYEKTIKKALQKGEFDECETFIKICKEHMKRNDKH